MNRILEIWTGKSLKHKLEKSILSSAGVSLVVLSLCLGMIYWLSSNVLELVNETGPVVQHSERLSGQIQDTQSQLLSWMIIDNQDFNKKRNNIWQEQIYLTMDELDILSNNWSSEEKSIFAIIKNDVYQLENKQWWIQDNHYSQGNNYPLFIYRTKVAVIYKVLLDKITEIINRESKTGTKSNLHHYANIRGALANSYSNLGLMISQSKGFLDDQLFVKNMKIVTEELSYFNDNKNTLSKSQKENLRVFNFDHKAYVQFTNQARGSINSSKSNITRDVFDNQVVSLVAKIEKNLASLKSGFNNSMEESSVIIKVLTPLVLIGLILFIIITAISSKRSVQQLIKDILIPVNSMITLVERVQSGNYKARVEDLNKDELGKLGVSLNLMVSSFDEITQVARAISQGDFTQNVKIQGEGDKLGLAINEMNHNLIEIVDQADKIAKGDFDSELKIKSEKDELSRVINKMTLTLRDNLVDLESSQKLNQAVIDTAQDGIITVGEDHLVISYNNSAQRIFGYSSEEVVGKNINMLIPLEHKSNVDKYIGDSENVAKGNKGRVVNGLRKNDQKFPLHLHIGESFIDDKKVLTGIVRDITDEVERSKEIELRTAEIENQNWLKTRVTEVFDVTKGVSKINDLLTAILDKITEHLDAGVGAFYTNDLLFSKNSKKTLSLTASYAYPLLKDEVKKVKFGEGLVGQAAVSKKQIIISPVPEDYISISSGIGEKIASEIIVQPILHENQVVGVIEIALFRSLEELEKEYFSEVVSSLGIIINGAIERTKTEDLSREVNNQISAINRSNAAIEFDMDGNILYANDLFLDLMNYSWEEIKGKHHSIFILEDYKKSKEYVKFWNELKEGKNTKGEFNRIGKFKDEVWIQGSYNPIVGADGKPYKVLKIATDITTQKIQSLKVSELSREIGNQMDAINRSNISAEFDMDGNMISCNDLFLDLMKYSKEEVIGKSMTLFINKSRSGSKVELSEFESFWSNLEKGKVQIGEFLRYNKLKEEVWIQGAFSPILNSNNTPYKVLLVGGDITRQKQQQQIIQETNEKLEAQEEELRVSNEELRMHAQKLQASEEELRVQQEELAEANEELMQKASLLEENNQSIIEQNAALEQAREALNLKANELESSGKYKSEFLANMSHELRTPLNSVLILAKLLSDNKTSNLTEKQVEFASVIYKSGSDLLKLINEVLDLAKVESGKVELDMEMISLKSVISSMKDTFTALAIDKEIDYQFYLDDELPKKIYSDELRLEQIIKNLLSNAFKFTPEKGTITVNITKSEPLSSFTMDSLIRSKELIKISVKDSGIGIPKEKLESVFEAFQQADGSTQRKYGGTGLGLSISRELANLLGGEITLTSEPNHGSEFTLYLPIGHKVKSNEKKKNEEIIPPVKKEASENIASDEVGFGGKGRQFDFVIADDREDLGDNDKTILIVEDDLQFAKILLDFAREKGFKGIVIDQGDLALKYVEAYEPNSIILDMKLPVMDGWTVLKKLKASKYAYIPIHVMSGMDKRKLGLELGAVDYLLKPISIDVLETAFVSIKKSLLIGVKRMLVIEDDENQNKAIKELVSRNDLIITSAYSGEEAIYKLKENKTDMVILDLGLPDVNGINLLKEIKQTWASLPVIVFTGRDLSKSEIAILDRFKDTSVVIKTDKSHQRLLEETELFIHHLEKSKSIIKQTTDKNKNKVYEMPDVLKGKKILMVDDDMRNIYALQTILDSEGIITSVAVNGLEAVEAVKTDPSIDAVLMDIMMPEMDGYEATKEIRKMGKSTLPIIALTAKAMKGDRQKCLDAGVSDYMSKPVDTDQLLSLLKVWLYK